MDRTGILLFYSEEPWSQWHHAPMDIFCVKYPTCEHYMMAEKARLFNDKDALRDIMATGDPRLAKSVGRLVAGFNKAKWDAVSLGVVIRGNLAKFTQHNDLAEMLLATGDRIIAEASPTDPVWGIGLAANDPRCLDPRDWLGENRLGHALMIVRSMLLRSRRWVCIACRHTWKEDAPPTHCPECNDEDWMMPRA